MLFKKGIKMPRRSKLILIAITLVAISTGVAQGMSTKSIEQGLGVCAIIFILEILATVGFFQPDQHV